MKIAFLVDSFPSLSETFILNQITGIIDAGHEVVIIAGARPDDRDFHDDIRKYDLLKKTYYHNDRPSNYWMRLLWAFALIVVYAPRNPKAVWNSLNVFKYKKEAAALTYFYKVILFLGLAPDVIYAQYGPNGNFAALLKEIGVKGKIVTMFHGYDIRRGIEQGGKMYDKLFKYADALLSISGYNYRHLVEFGAPVGKIRVHPVGIDLTRYRYQEHPLGATQKVTIITVGRLVKEKGIEDGLRAIKRLSGERSLDFEYIIIGDGLLRSSLEALALEMGLTARVRFLGACVQEHVINALNEAHIFFLPSVAEALPVVLMEAQAVGLPVVATDVGSVRELVKDGESGFVVPAGDIEAMSGRLGHLMNHPESWKVLGAAGRTHVEQHYDIRKLNQKLIDLCQELIAQ